MLTFLEGKIWHKEYSASPIKLLFNKLTEAIIY